MGLISYRKCRFARIIMRYKNEAGQSELALRHLGSSLLSERRFHIKAVQMFKVLHDLAPARLSNIFRNSCSYLPIFASNKDKTIATCTYYCKRSKCFKLKYSRLLKHFLRTRSDDAWPLIEFTPWEKQKYKVTIVTKNKISRFICIQLAHALFQTSRLILSITKILSLTHRKCQSKRNIWILPLL